MPTKVSFIGRETELEKILSFAAEEKTRKVLLIEGDGGIGKSALLTEAREKCLNIEEEYQKLLGSEIELDDLHIIDIIDFDNRLNHIPEVVRNFIAEQLDANSFKNYYKLLEDLRMMKAKKVEGFELQEKEKEVRSSFVTDFNKFSQQNRVVIFFDTMDSLPATTIWDRLIDFILEVKNVLFVLAGRSSIKLIEHIEPRLGDDVERLILQPMSEKDSMNYLNLKKQQLHLNIPDSLTEKLLYIARGLPIIVDLAVEWLARGVRLDWLEKVEPTQTEKINIQQLKLWENLLVSHIADLHHPMNELCLVLSRIYPLDKDGLRVFFSEQDYDADLLFEQAQNFVFIKTISGKSLTISLHDEMRRMVSEYVWPEYDPDGTQRKSESKIAISYIMEQLRNTENQLDKLEKNPTSVSHPALVRIDLDSELSILNKQLVEHEVFVNLFEDFDRYKDESNKARRGYDFVFARRLQESIASLYPLFNNEQQYQFDLLKGRLQYRLQENKSAQKLFKKLLRQNKDDDYRRGEIYNGLGICEMNLADLKKALMYQKKALKVFTEGKYEYPIPFVANQIGLIYSKLERWEEAVKTFQKAFDAANNLPVGQKRDSETHKKRIPQDEKMDLMAGIMNYWGFANAMIGRRDEAFDYCSEAIETWKILKLPRKMARGYALLGAVHRIREEFGLAESFLEEAIKGIELPNDSERMVQAYSDLGFTYHIMGVDPELEQILKAQSLLDIGVSIAKKYDVRLELPLLQSRLARVYWLFFQKDPDNSTDPKIAEYKRKARKTNEIAYEGAEKNGHTYTIAKCILGRAEFDIEDPKASEDKIPQYAIQLQNALKKSPKKYPLFEGRMDRIQAEMFFKKKDFNKAIQFYADGLSKINLHGGYGTYSIEEELKKLSAELAMLPKTDALQMIVELNTFWNNNSYRKTNQRLISWCRSQTVRINASQRR